MRFWAPQSSENAFSKFRKNFFQLWVRQMLSFFTPQVFPFCCLRVFGDEKVLPWGVTVHVINALASLSHLASTPLSLSLSLLLHLLASKAIVCTGETSEKGPIAPLPILPVLFARSLFPVPRLGEIDRRGLCPGITHIPDLDQNTKHVFLSHPRHSDDHQRG